MMKVPKIWVSCVVVATVLMLFNFPWVAESTSLPSSEVVFNDRGGGGMLTATSRKLKLQEKGYNSDPGKKTYASRLNLYDYQPIDPVPSSKTSIEPGPINHGIPLNPFIPKPALPCPPPEKVG